MKKNILMLIAFATVFAIGTACFTPSSKQDPGAPAQGPTAVPGR